MKKGHGARGQGGNRERGEAAEKERWGRQESNEGWNWTNDYRVCKRERQERKESMNAMLYNKASWYHFNS